MSNNHEYSQGSEWNKWDLHVHTPASYKNEFPNWETYIEKLKEKAVEHNIKVVGINDYFSVDGYEKLLEECEVITKWTTPRIKLANDEWLYLFPIVELRLENFSHNEESVNIHVVFSPELLSSTIRNDFIEKLTIKYQSFNLFCKTDNLIKIGYAEENQGQYNANLNISSISDPEKNRFIKKAFQLISFSTSIFEESIEIFRTILQDSGIKDDKYLILIANKGHGGLDGFDWYNKYGDTSRAGNIRQNLLNLADICFSNSIDDINFLLGKKEDTPKKEILNRFRSLKPCIWGSDAHTENNIFHPSDGHTNHYTWIKANPTFEGLKQIVYEPEVGERVQIGPVKPDLKDDYKVIHKIIFNNTDTFPEEIEFNKNLCSIIGSRSSGKSALLAYVAHAIDKKLVESLIDGPGEGKDYQWDKIDIDYLIKWKNGKSNNESPGKIIYIPQNYLFIKSQDPDEIKEKIKPVLFKVLPDFKTKYTQTLNTITTINQQISEQIEKWFETSDQIQFFDKELQNLGDKKAVEKEKGDIESKIEILRTKNRLSEEEIKKYQQISADISTYKSRIEQIKNDLSQISNVSIEQGYFSSLKQTLIPPLENLPKKLQEEIEGKLLEKSSDVLTELNQQVINYKISIEKEKSDTEDNIKKIEKDNNELIEKYQKNIELEGFVKKLNDYNKIIGDIDNIEEIKKVFYSELEACKNNIVSKINKRAALIEELKTEIDSPVQSGLEGIKFGMEYELSDDLKFVTQKVNIHDRSEFIKNGNLKMNYIRENPNKFLSAVYFGKQKINIGNDKMEVVQEILSLTEKILFTAEMEGDKIGGFSKSTMTPGKRALFTLRLILSESDDTWPLLIDQPEDDLDSRSIYEEIVPFLKMKKKKRQIIMVSHNANLVIGSDSEQIIVANRNADDRKNIDGKLFNYLTGSIEFTKEKDDSCEDTLRAQGTREHACLILDGGKIAFEQRRNKYNLI